MQLDSLISLLRGPDCNKFKQFSVKSKVFKNNIIFNAIVIDHYMAALILPFNNIIVNYLSINTHPFNNFL